MNALSYPVRMTLMLLITSLFASNVRAQVSAKPDPAPFLALQASAWTPDPKLLPLLGPAQKLGPITLRVPKGCLVKNIPQGHPASLGGMYQITGPGYGGGVPATLNIYYFINMRHHALIGLPKMLANQFRVYRQNLLSHYPAQYGKIHGLPFGRQTYAYDIRPNIGGPFDAFEYVYESSPTVIIITGAAPPAHAAATLPLLQASVLTLRKMP